jgi:hypothetical protein
MLIGFLYFTSKKKPYSNVALNDLEVYSLIASMVTIYCGIFFISDVAASDSSSETS